MKMSAGDTCMMKHQAQNGDCGNKSKQNSSSTFCNFCILCIAFIVPVKPGIQRNFVSGIACYGDLVQGKLTDFNPSHWRPPNA
jgi:hypothetical protein